MYLIQLALVLKKNAGEIIWLMTVTRWISAANKWQINRQTLIYIYEIKMLYYTWYNLIYYLTIKPQLSE